MQNEVHIFLGTAIIAEDHTSNYPIGEKHAILLFLREDIGSEYNLTRAKEIIRSCKLKMPEFTKIGRLDPNRISDKHRDCYKEALESGSALVLYADPI